MTVYTTANLPAGVVTLEQAKKDPKPGTKFFVERTGSIGEILPDRSAHGKLQARMTCNKGGQDHIREVSDWHQCGTSPDMKKRAKKAKSPVAAAAPAEAVDVVANAEKIREQLTAQLAKAQAEAGVAPKTDAEKQEVKAEDVGDVSDVLGATG